MAAGDQNPPPAVQVGGSDPVGGDASAQASAATANIDSPVQGSVASEEVGSAPSFSLSSLSLLFFSLFFFF